MKLVKDTDNKNLEANKVSDKEAEEAFKTYISLDGRRSKSRRIVRNTKESC
jgi:hypothetical protein